MTDGGKIVLDGIKPEDRISALRLAEGFQCEKLGQWHGTGFWSSEKPNVSFHVWRNKGGVVVRAYYDGQRLGEAQ